VDRARAVGRGDLHHPTSEQHGRGVEPNADESSSRPFGGTAAVSYDGVVYPCIFSRHLALGSVRRQALRAILTAPEPVATPSENLLTERGVWAAQLACWECQTRSQMFGTGVDA
jgi:MoaA/NifB/PqqE/SkfB family radical SAM enzyme